MPALDRWRRYIMNHALIPPLHSSPDTADKLVNVRVDDLTEDRTKLRIRDESSKTFGRTINLLLCPTLLREYINEHGLQETDRLFPICYGAANRYICRLATRLFGDGKTHGGTPYNKLTMYDLQHSSACYRLPRYENEGALKYRFDWKRSEMIHYYTVFLGTKDTITEEDLCMDTEKHAYERKVERAEREKRQLEEELSALHRQLDQILGVVTNLVEKTGGVPQASSPPCSASPSPAEAD